METIIVKESEDTPYVLMDVSNSRLEIKGKSYPENAIVFYKPIFDWVKSLSQKGISKLEVNLEYDYFNSASFKMIFDLLFELEALRETYGLDVNVNWYYEYQSQDIREAGVDLSEFIKLPFHITNR